MNTAKYLKQSKESRLKNLHEKSDAVEQISYDKSFTASEMAEIKDELADESIKLSDVEAEFKEVKQTYTDQMAPMKQTIKLAIGHLKSGKRLVTEPCFKFVDRDNKETGYYNEDGELVYSRPANLDEMQFTIQHDMGDGYKDVPALAGDGYRVGVKE
jgi:hypothetical protein